MSDSDDHAKQIRHWLKKADDAKRNDNDEEALAARYTAGAAARLWALGKLDDEHDESQDVWASVKDHAEQANKYQDDDDEDQALFHRAQANIFALRAFEESGQAQGSDADEDDTDDAKSDASDDKAEKQSVNAE